MVNGLHTRRTSMKKKAAHVPREDVETNQRGMSPWTGMWKRFSLRTFTLARSAVKLTRPNCWTKTGPEAPSPMRPPDVSQTNRDVRTAASKAGIKVQQSQQNAGRCVTPQQPAASLCVTQHAWQRRVVGSNSDCGACSQCTK